jgi:hypothetical protein
MISHNHLWNFRRPKIHSINLDYSTVISGFFQLVLATLAHSRGTFSGKGPGKERHSKLIVFLNFNIENENLKFPAMRYNCQNNILFPETIPLNSNNYCRCSLSLGQISASILTVILIKIRSCSLLSVINTP